MAWGAARLGLPLALALQLGHACGPKPRKKEAPMSDTLQRLTHALLDAARKAGAESADAMALHGSSTSIDIRAGALEQAERSEAVEIGLRVLIGGRQACVSASDTSAATISALAERAVAMAREAPEDQTAGLADPSQIARHWDLAGLELADPADEPSAAALEQDARAARHGLDYTRCTRGA